MDLAIVIVNWNGRGLLWRCLESIDKTAGDLNYAIIVVDNGSTDGSQTMVRTEFPAVTLIANDKNLGFGAANNVGMRTNLVEHTTAQLPTHPLPPSALFSGHYHFAADYLLLLNPDTVVQPGALQALVQFMHDHPHVGIAGAQLQNEDGSFQASYVDFPCLKQEFMILTGLGRKLQNPAYPSASHTASQTPRDDVDYVIGACMIARSTAVQDVGLFDEGFFMYAEEVDWCYRFHAAGWSVGYVPNALITHLGGGSTRQVRPQMLAELYRSRVHFFHKHYNFVSTSALRSLLLLMNGIKMLRSHIRRGDTIDGTPPLPWPLLLYALADSHAGVYLQKSQGSS